MAAAGSTRQNIWAEVVAMHWARVIRIVIALGYVRLVM